MVTIDLSSNMTQIGLDRAEEVGCGPDQVVFEIADATKREYKPESFDVIYSRDTILHIEDKLSLFKRFFVSNVFKRNKCVLLVQHVRI